MNSKSAKWDNVVQGSHNELGLPVQTSGRAILKVSPWVHQAGVLHAISSISMQLGELNSLKCHPSLRPTPQRVCRQFEGWWGEETDDYQLKGCTPKLKMKSWVITTFFAKRRASITGKSRKQNVGR